MNSTIILYEILLLLGQSVNRGEKHRGSETVLAKLRELAATDGVVANGLNLA